MGAKRPCPYAENPVGAQALVSQEPDEKRRTLKAFTTSGKPRQQAVKSYGLTDGGVSIRADGAPACGAGDELGKRRIRPGSPERQGCTAGVDEDGDVDGLCQV